MSTDRAIEVEAYGHAQFAQLRVAAIVMAIVCLTTLAAAACLRAWGLVAVPGNEVGMAARYGPILLAAACLLLPILLRHVQMIARQRRREAKLVPADDDGPPSDANDWKMLAIMNYQSAVMGASLLLTGGAVLEAGAYWLTGRVVPLAMAVLLLATLVWGFPTRDRMGRAIEDELVSSPSP